MSKEAQKFKPVESLKKKKMSQTSSDVSAISFRILHFLILQTAKKSIFRKLGLW